MSSVEKRVACVVLAGGLGNQLFQLSCAVEAANGRRLVALPLRGSVRSNREGVPDSLSVTGSSHISVIRPVAAPMRVVSRESLRRSSRGSTRVRDIEWFLRYLPGTRSVIPRDTPTKVLLDASATQVLEASKGDDDLNLFIAGYFQDSRIARSALGNPMLLRILGLSSIQELKPKHDVVGLHVRGGDYFHNPQLGILSSRYYRWALELLAGEANTERLRVDVFTDDVSRFRAIERDLPREHSYTLIPAQSREPWSVIGQISAYRRLVMANSTFSYWGALLGKQPKQVVFPSPFYSRMRTHPRFIPDDWIAVNSDFCSAQGN